MSVHSFRPADLCPSAHRPSGAMCSIRHTSDVRPVGTVGGVGWREDLHRRLKLRGQRDAVNEPACPECAAARTIPTVDRGFVCPTGEHVWTAEAPRTWRTFVPVTDSQSPPFCPQCGIPMTHEDARREP